ncbi:CDP-glycerol glycerophosphotransferase family protein [Streptantibioticus rubrisoli]|uniref:Bifunctional glycosyltransferase family 2 protein/CDP-glycerol:glycerophosphate glycerophosphotransferase n=1 Tax=Streptantibioticus rubrisoli TaxID=1387313 RepID=A0ABT1PE60_9ACTN|nr:bifunctional glycosyltransferase family 2 protein/CDP-glycerol:glycerophosphate glycerophosphotransferase [Streptantibioticus rubrisoli]MCQ4042523.1 bifunctional glycosyltransferase family 2 protein/CDP-glycerol:glycerophosphate glycerophosphotransferase [Streptantibioticus rubrisoli]
MTRFSVIVPAYQVQAYLSECLESVLVQDYPDFEVIAVDDHSPDGSGEIIDDFAARDRRVVPVHLPHNGGLGPARNAGMARARGDYLLFLDGDDTFAPGALRAIADRLQRTGDPDVLVYDYDRTYWTGEAQRNALSHHLGQAGPPVFTLDDRPELLRLLMIACNKAYRREYIARLGLAFPSGFYEDTPWTYPTLLAAGSIAVLDRVCLHYRQRRRGNILSTTSRRHFDIFDQYDRVFAFLDEHPELARWRPVLFERMLDHLGTVYNSPGRLPRSARTEFFRRCRAQYRRHRPAQRRPAASRRSSVRYLLTRLGAGRTYRLLWRVDQLGRAARGAARTAYRKLRAALLLAHYRLQAHRRIDPHLAVFAAYWNRGYSCNPAAIEAAVRQLAPHIRTAWITTPEFAHTLPEGVRRLHPGSAAYWTALARAKYLVNNVNFTHRLVKRPGQIHLQTHHGTPLKHMGLDLQEYPAAAAGTDFDRLLAHADRWDYVLSANRHSTLVWERAYPASYTTLEYGYPRNDALYRASADDVRRIRDRLGIATGTTALLYAPTHRDYRRGQFPLMDLERLARALGPRFVLLVRSHYFYQQPLTTASADGATVLDVSGHPSIEELCLAADGLLTDYSSVMFDYANLDRPIVIHAGDWAAYRAARGTYFDITTEPPGIVAEDEDALAEAFTSGAWCGPRAAELRAAFRARFCRYDDGHAAERVVRRVFLDERQPDGLPPVLPLSDRTPAPPPGECADGVQRAAQRPSRGTGPDGTEPVGGLSGRTPGGGAGTSARPPNARSSAPAEWSAAARARPLRPST